MASVAIILQGPLDPIGLRNWENYARHGQVIASCWHGDDRSLVPPKVALVETFVPEINWHNCNNVWKQVTTTLRGIEATNADIIVKTRCDESFSDLSAVIDECLKTRKVVACNTYFRKDRYFRYHASDHLIAARRQVFQAAMRTAKSFCEMHDNFPCPPEIVITKSFLWSQGVVTSPVYSRAIMTDHFSVVPITRLGTITCQLVHHGAVHHYDHAMFEGDSCVFDSMEQL